MTYPRSDIYCEDESGTFHCISRCVRRAFLCGFDRYSSKSFEHRRAWIKVRLTQLLEVFAMDCLAYAVMSNHVHSILVTLPEVAQGWSDTEVARRWRVLFPYRRRPDGGAAKPNDEEIREITSDPKTVAKYRKRLSNLSWFNRCLNENIARKANAEDDCTGRFWEGRFKSIRLEKAQSVLACSVYVDLNPLRAGVAKRLEECSFTSLQDRIMDITCLGSIMGPRLAAHSYYTFEEITPEAYIKLVEETGKLLVDKKCALSPDTVSVLERLKIRPQGWVENARHQGKLFRRIIGPIESIKAFAARKGRAWFQGMQAAKVVFA